MGIMVSQLTKLPDGKKDTVAILCKILRLTLAIEYAELTTLIIDIFEAGAEEVKKFQPIST